MLEICYNGLLLKGHSYHCCHGATKSCWNNHPTRYEQNQYGREVHHEVWIARGLQFPSFEHVLVPVSKKLQFVSGFLWSLVMFAKHENKQD